VGNKIKVGTAEFHFQLCVTTKQAHNQTHQFFLLLLKGPSLVPEFHSRRNLPVRVARLLFFSYFPSNLSMVSSKGQRDEVGIGRVGARARQLIIVFLLKLSATLHES